MGYTWLVSWGLWTVAWFWNRPDFRSAALWLGASAASAVWVLWCSRRGILHSERREHSRIDEILRRREIVWIQAVQSLRHHWLNEWQLVRGYAQMGRWDRVQAVVDRVTVSAEAQSRATDAAHPHRSGLMLRTLCEFPHLSVDWRGGADEDVPWVAVEEVEPLLRRHLAERTAGEGRDSPAAVCLGIGGRAKRRGQESLSFSVEIVSPEQGPDMGRDGADVD